MPHNSSKIVEMKLQKINHKNLAGVTHQTQTTPIMDRQQQKHILDHQLRHQDSTYLCIQNGQH